MTEAKKPGRKAGDAGLSAGQQLKNARAERNLTIQQVGQALHLDTWILEALEEDRFRDVGAPVFVKGHLRKYAAEVGVDQDELMEAYYRAEDTPETPQLVTDTFTRPESSRQVHWPVIAVSAVVVLLIIALSALWLRGDGPGFSIFGERDSGAEQEGDNTPAVPAQSTVPEEPPVQAPVTATSTAAAASPDTGSTASEPAESNIEEADDTVAAVRASAASVESEVLDDGLVELSISFREDSWVEIYDAARRRLFFDLARSGTTRTVRGEPPLQVLLGNASTARVRVDGEVWPIPAAARRGKTARFTVR